MKREFWFYLQLLSENFSFQEESSQVLSQMHTRLHV